MGCQSSKGDVAAIVSSYEGKKAAHSIRKAFTPRGRGIQGNLVELHPDVASLDDFYILGRKLGEGSYGSVSLATCKTTGRQVAIKTIQKANDVEASQLGNEIEILRNLDHPNIVRLYDIYDGPTNVHIAVEYCSGGDVFHKWARNEHRLAEDAVKIVVLKLLCALAYLHDRQFVHRDVKIENMLFRTDDPDAEISLCDFGMGQTEENRSGAYVSGTLLNLAPEIFEGQLSSAVDMWATACVAYELLSGEAVFGGDDDHAVKKDILESEPSFTDTVWKSTSKEAIDLIKKMLIKDPTKRITAKQALGHTWFASIRSPSKRGKRMVMARNEVNQLLLQFSTMSPLRQFCLMVVAFILSPDKLGSQRANFDEIDADNTGSITRDELDRYFKKNQVKSDVQALFDAIDNDHSGKVNYLEFLAATVPVSYLDDPKILRHAFDRLNVDHSGYISADNLKEIMGQDYDRARVESMIASADFDADNRISYDEFVRMMRGEKVSVGSVGLNDVTSALENAR